MRAFKKAYSTSFIPVNASGAVDATKDLVVGGHDYFGACTHYGQACEEILQRTGRENPCMLLLYARTIYLAVMSTETSNPLVVRESVILLEQAKCLLFVAHQNARTEKLAQFNFVLFDKVEQLQLQLKQMATQLENVQLSEAELEYFIAEKAVLVSDG